MKNRFGVADFEFLSQPRGNDLCMRVRQSARHSALKSTSSPGFSRFGKREDPVDEVRKRLKKFPYLTTVGNNSAENTNIASKEFMTENLPIIAKMIRPATKPRQERKQRIFTISS